MYYINITSEKQKPICYEKENEKLRSLAFKCLNVNFVFTKSNTLLPLVSASKILSLEF